MRKATWTLAIAALTLAPASAAERSISRGRGSVDVDSIYSCPTATSRPSPIGRISGSDSRTWTVPAATQFASGPKAPDLYNDCTGVRPASIADVRAPRVVTVDEDGEEVKAWLLADNYFELYVNGVLVAVDPVPFTPFNSAIVRFKAKRPFTYALLLVDWEEHPGLGTESGGGAHHPGDGGFIARFSDGTVTDETWKAQSFYIAPLADPALVQESGNVHDTPTLARVYPEAPAQAACGEHCYAIHYPIPDDWSRPAFDDRQWPAARVFTPAQMGIQRLPAYGNVRSLFGDAVPIWSSNLVLDNLVLVRKRVE